MDVAQADDPENYEQRAREVFGTRSLARTDLPSRDLDSDLLYKFLLAEIAAQRGDFQIAAQAYLEMAKTSRDPRVARRATELALYGRNNEMALQSARIWLEVEKNSAPARQTVAALLVNANNLQAAKPLLRDMLAADGDNVGPALLQLHGLLAKHSDKNAVLALVKELTKPYNQYPEAHFAVAQAAANAADDPLALAEIRKAAELRPEWPAAVLFEVQILQKTSND
ncbi:MAG TPA: hypothetical protein VEW72_07790, partial [Burkholderiales bacterium]|nr:hypothetical protein [Burkholderiales bacterium]